MDAEPVLDLSDLDTKEALVEAGIHQISEKGYDGASIEDITRIANVSKGAFYYHFKSKEEFVLTIIRQHAVKNIARFRKLDQENISLSDWIEASFSMIIGFPSKDPTWQQFSLEVMMAGMRQEHKLIGELVAELHAEWRQLIAEMVIKKKEYRQGRVCCEEEVIAVGIMALVDGLLMHSNLEHDTFTNKAFIQRLAPLLKLWVTQSETEEQR